MKIKGLKSTVKQITFEGDKHPNYGVVSTITWGDLAEHLEEQNDDDVLSFKIEADGLKVFWKTDASLGRQTKL